MATFVESLKRYFFPEPGTPAPAVPEGVCPNCWGHHEYDGQVRKAMSDQRIAVQKGQAQDAFIQTFVVKHVDGIRLRPVNGQQACPTCDASS